MSAGPFAELGGVLEMVDMATLIAIAEHQLGHLGMPHDMTDAIRLNTLSELARRDARRPL